MHPLAEKIYKARYAQEGENWKGVAQRVTREVFSAVDAPAELCANTFLEVEDRVLMPGGRYLFASGREVHQTSNCCLYRAEDSREGWSSLMRRITMSLMTGAGIGVVYSDLRERGAPIKRMGGVSSGPCALMQAVNDMARKVRQGGTRRAAVWAGLHWWHPDIEEFITQKNWPDEVRALKEKDPDFPATMDMTNISVILDDEFFEAYHNPAHPKTVLAGKIYWMTVERMLRTSEPGFSVNIGENAGEDLRNAPVSGNTYIKTRHGFRQVKETIGFKVEVWTGKQWALTEFKKTKEHAKVVRVTLSDGTQIVCDPEHEFLKAGKDLMSAERIPASQLSLGTTLFSADGSYIYVYSNPEHAGYEDVFCCDVGVEEHSFQAEGVIISNCCEITSRDDNDICNLASINLARVEDLKHMEKVCRLAAAFCVAGSVYSDVPHEEIRATREKNRRIGVGLMGLHEWLLRHGKKYGPDEELEKYLEIYREHVHESAQAWARDWRLSLPVKTRSIAPNGTIGIVAGPTTTGIEPLFCTAYKRRFLEGEHWREEYVVDPIVQRLVREGVDPDLIEDAYGIDVERRVAFQAWVQQYVDHAISSTINIPRWGSPTNNKDTVQGFGNMLIDYLPQLRGITCYAEGSRSGQPLTPVPYEEAVAHGAVEKAADVCDITKGESCGD